MLDLPPPHVNASPARVSYPSHLFRVARTDAWRWAVEHRVNAIVPGSVCFFAVALGAWLLRGGEAEVLAPVLAGLLATGLLAVAFFAAHFFYLTPRKLCAAKQQQLDAERREFALALEREQQAAQLAIAERDVLKARIEERPLRPLELRQEIDQLIAEGDALLAAEEQTLIGESELWFDDVERFAKRHLSPRLYDQLVAASPADLAAEIQRRRGHRENGQVHDEERVIAERLVRLDAGLRAVRQAIEA